MDNEDRNIILGFVAFVLFLVALLLIVGYIHQNGQKDKLLLRLAADGVLQVDEEGRFLYKCQRVE